MAIVELLDPGISVSTPPPGAINTRVGESIKGAGGTWVPCSTRSGRTYFAGLFQVGPGCRQICDLSSPLSCEEAAFLRAVEMAKAAAA